ncbi:MAG: molybdopterin molybdenumtransferase MoeA, partial [Catenulisporales bacterium]|nr:molybdopterin molybdenumtransferase MoeA [Catenulisporales bacterium]
MAEPDTEKMRSVDDHLKLVLDTVQLLAPMELPITDVNGLTLADDVVATMPLPPFDNSSVDGYAVRLADLEGAAEDSPAELRVVGDIAAGSVFEGILEPGTCARIMTGAMVPHGAEAIVPVEWTDGGT